MATTVTPDTRHDLLQAVHSRYRAGTKDEKLHILDQVVAITGYHRKHVIRLMRARPVAQPPCLARAQHLSFYDTAVREAVIVLWEASDRVCGKRLQPLLPILLSALERHGQPHA